MPAGNRQRNDVTQQRGPRRLSGDQLSTPLAPFFRHTSSGSIVTGRSNPHVHSGHNERAGRQRVSILRNPLKSPTEICTTSASAASSRKRCVRLFDSQILLLMLFSFLTGKSFLLGNQGFHRMDYGARLPLFNAHGRLNYTTITIAAVAD